MPLIKRHVEPVHLSRGVIDRGIKNELECVTNSTLAGVIRQLSNLSKHAEDIFGDLYQEANSVFVRANILQDRIDKLSVKVTMLDATQDPVSLQDILACTPFQSKLILDQEMLAREKRPTAVHDTYTNKCEPPPNLSILTQYREDGKEGLEFYTKPRYFFELWCEEQKKNISILKQERRHRRKQRHPREKGISHQPRAAKTRKQQWESMKDGEDLRQNQGLTDDDHKPPPEEIHENSSVQHQTHIRDDRQSYSDSPYQDQGGLGRQETRRHAPHRPAAAPPPPPPQPMSNGGLPMNTGYQNEYNLQQQYVPSPPEYPDVPPYQSQMISDQDYRQDLQHNEPHQDLQQIPVAPPPPMAGLSYPEPSLMHDHGQSSYIPAPPPPPNVGFIPSPPPVPQGPAVPTMTSSPARAPPVQEEPDDNPRSDLLSAIRTGIKLREVDRTQAKKQGSDSTPNSVAAILARRLAVELSDSEDSNTSSDWEDDEDWD